MRILLVGSGGREHALAWRLSHEAEVLATPGNPGIAEDVETANILSTNFEGILKLAKSFSADFVMFGPEDPLIQGGADYLRENQMPVFGPDRAAARLEGSKAYAKDLMRSAKIPTAQFETFHDPMLAKTYARTRAADGYQVVVKASGNALGKGVVVCDDIRQAEDAIDMMMVQGAFGVAGKEIVIEDRLDGREFSLFTLVSDRYMVSLPVARDYKRVGDSDNGPNTGGMGTYSPDTSVSSTLIEEVENQIVKPSLAALHRDGLHFRGVLFTGIMMHHGRPHCLEFNVRFGDPETQSLMMRCEGGLADALFACAKGEPIAAPQFSDQAAVTVVLASQGYPGEYVKGLPVRIGTLPEGIKVFHAGTAMQDGRLVTHGGRVLNVSATGPTLAETRAKVYQAIHHVTFEGAFCRSDIAAEATPTN